MRLFLKTDKQEKLNTIILKCRQTEIVKLDCSKRETDRKVKIRLFSETDRQKR